ncbi:hypothetical protein RWE15_21200 [Virgibacillus halophilus]|uniref:Uncharacterized protein n=1 Tax=Tigheibacillus halophilus TaxID=361280 RepID=A0ABU5CAP4_9BACI|nr:hypothetical protein [Virgibacillus halophilus]
MVIDRSRLEQISSEMDQKGSAGNGRTYVQNLQRFTGYYFIDAHGSD